MFEAVERELRAKLVGTGKQIHNRGFPAAQTPRHTPRRRLLATLRTTDPSRKTPPHALSRTDDEVTANPSHSSPTVPTSRSRCRYAEGRPGGRPLSVSHQHSASSPSKLLNMSLVGIIRARVARAVFPCDDTYCRRPTLRQRQGQLRKPWDFDPTDNWTQNECAPPGDRERTPCHAHSACCVRACSIVCVSVFLFERIDA